MFPPGITGSKTLTLVVLLLPLAGCGPSDDDPETVEGPGLTNVDPSDATIPGEPPAFGNSPTGESDDQYAIDPRELQEKEIDPVDVDLYAVASIRPAGSSNVSGDLRFHQQGDTLRINGTLRGLEAGEHGLHIHAVGDCSAPDAAAAQGHFAPDDDPHGSPSSPNDLHHVGDLGNITATEDGVADVRKTDSEMSLETGDMTILGRAVIVHADSDDLVSRPAGDAGIRVGCGVVELEVAPAYTGAPSAADSQRTD